MPAADPPPPQSSPERRFGDLGRMLDATLRGRCPNCRRGAMFRSFYALHERCPACGVRLERDSGSWLGAAVMAYGAAVLAVLALALLLIPRYGLFEGLGPVLVGAALLAVLLVYRPAKGWWLWWLWAAGFVYRDDTPPQRRRG